MHVVESGPAAGVIGAQALARRIGLPNAISFDMGGTTAKAGVIENGEVTRAGEYRSAAASWSARRLLSGAGYQLKVPAIDLAEVGAGGGSHGLARRRRRAAGRAARAPAPYPGPACYGRGGTEPTVTDANVVLGYLNPHALVGGALPIDAGGVARRASPPRSPNRSA